MLFYCKSPELEPCGIIPLENLEVKSAPDIKKKFCFILSNPNNSEIKATKKNNGALVKGHHKDYIVQAKSAVIMEEWISAINRNIHRNPFYDLVAQKRALGEKKVLKQSPIEDSKLNNDNKKDSTKEKKEVSKKEKRKSFRKSYLTKKSQNLEKSRKTLAELSFDETKRQTL
eukprot:TRINITY_DN926_c0_g1_i3.p1 TRINITY_DN926_c0_g1~~TRINITY_DN926_c0_g1_i3.p1  ORF type:complete len:172 (-),score=32.09 TRINITY_DN926_c0_g1_i3:21-536(-)